MTANRAKTHKKYLPPTPILKQNSLASRLYNNRYYYPCNVNLDQLNRAKSEGGG